MHRATFRWRVINSPVRPTSNAAGYCIRRTAWYSGTSNRSRTCRRVPVYGGRTRACTYQVRLWPMKELTRRAIMAENFLESEMLDFRTVTLNLEPKQISTRRSIPMAAQLKGSLIHVFGIPSNLPVRSRTWASDLICLPTSKIWGSSRPPSQRPTAGCRQNGSPDKLKFGLFLFGRRIKRIRYEYHRHRCYGYPRQNPCL